MAKKDFSNLSNPALQFITGAEDTHNTQYTPNTQDTQKENKTKRLNLTITPALAEDLKKIAKMEDKSVNALINDVMKAYAISNQATIERYNEVFKK